MAAVVAELHERFPGVPAPVIDQVVAERVRQFDGAPVRDYIAVMVKRDARQSIAAMVRESRARFDHGR